MKNIKILRKTKQEIMPQFLNTEHLNANVYNLYPFHSFEHGKIGAGYKSLADQISDWPIVKIDGYAGIDWEQVKSSLQDAFSEKDILVNWIEMSQFYKPEKEIAELVLPFLGETGAVWGKNTDLTLADFFVANLPAITELDSASQINIIIGVGAELAPIEAPIIYF